MDYENQNNFFPLLNLAKALLNARGHQSLSDLINKSSISVVNTDYDNWNGGTYGYTVYIYISVKDYSTLSSDKIKEIEENISSVLNEVNKTDENSYFSVAVTPSIRSCDIDWSLIGGIACKEELRLCIEKIREIMILVATFKTRIEEEEDRYKSLVQKAYSECLKLNVPYTNPYYSLWDWHRKWKNDFPTYQERRIYVNNLFSYTLSFFDDNENESMELLVKLDEWERIKRTITKIKRDSISAKNEEDFQSVGLLCRDVIISLAQSVYIPFIHGEYDESGTKISNTDAVRMIGNYLRPIMQGKQHKELRDYARVTNAIANQLTHKRTATRTDMLLAINSTIALINFIGILENKL